MLAHVGVHSRELDFIFFLKKKYAKLGDPLQFHFTYRIVQQIDVGLAVHRPRQADALLLAAGQVDALLADLSLDVIGFPIINKTNFIFYEISPGLLRGASPDQAPWRRPQEP